MYETSNKLIESSNQMNPNTDRHTIVMANIVELMVIAIENWYDEKVKDE